MAGWLRRHVGWLAGAVLLAVLLALGQRLWLGPHGLDDKRGLEAQVSFEERRVAELRARNALKAAEVDDLKTGVAATEAHARKDLNMVRPGETFYQLPESFDRGLADGRSADEALAATPVPASVSDLATAAPAPDESPSR